MDSLKDNIQDNLQDCVEVQPELSPFNEVIKDIKAGRMIILVDDVDRENEGDLTVATEKLTTAHIQFMMQEARGQICISIPQDIAEKLELPLQVLNNSSQFQTPFAVSVDEKNHISATASDRAATMKHIIESTSTPDDFVSPGHVFPLIVNRAGVLGRHGQTEGSHDLALISGCFPSGVICEILNPDGTMARGKELFEFATQHNLKITSVAEIAKYRIQHEALVRNISRRKINTPYGMFEALTFYDDVESAEHIALVYGDINNASKPLVASCCEDIQKDLLHGFGSKIPEILQNIANHGSGVLIYLIHSTEPKILNSLKISVIVANILSFLEINDYV